MRMQPEELQALLDIVRRRPLTPAELARLERCLNEAPEQRAFWEEETALTERLHALADIPVASNFTAQVLAALERGSVRRRGPFALRLPAWLRQPVGQWACALAILLAAGVVHDRYRASHRAVMAASVADVSRRMQATVEEAGVPSVEILLDFEPIHRLSEVHALADEELLRAFE